MPPLPKRKHSKGRRDRRRAHDALVPTELITCNNCSVPVAPHTVCPNCGYYDGRQVFEPKKKKKKST